jgi:hypothetical protein
MRILFIACRWPGAHPGSAHRRASNPGFDSTLNGWVPLIPVAVALQAKSIRRCAGTLERSIRRGRDWDLLQL